MSKPVSIDLYTALIESPNYVRVYCPQCYRGISSIETKLADILDRLKSVEETVGDIRGIQSHPGNKAGGSEDYKKALLSAKSASTRLAKELNIQNKPILEAQRAESNKRTRTRSPEPVLFVPL